MFLTLVYPLKKPTTVRFIRAESSPFFPEFDQRADHIRMMMVWPWVQPNPRTVSHAHLDRLDVIMALAAERNLDVCVTMLTGWLSVLEASFVVFRLAPYHRNFGKRLTKSPKLYFVDPGLASYLLGLETVDQVERDPAAGGLFENLVVVDALKSRLNRGLDSNLHFFRDSNGNDVDLLFPDDEGGLMPIEIKSAQTYHDEFTKGIRYYQKTSGSSVAGRIIYAGDMEFTSESYEVVHFSRAFT